MDMTDKNNAMLWQIFIIQQVRDHWKRIHYMGINGELYIIGVLCILSKFVTAVHM